MKNLTLEIIIIAAGTSSRLGQPKQLVDFGEKTLLQNTVDLAKSLKYKTHCVLGYSAEEIKQQINFNQVNLILNKNYRQGMPSSIALGIKNLQKDCDAVLILLCDQ